MTNSNKITFCINTAKNELPYIKLLFESLKCNLYDINHHIIVFVDSDNQGTYEWLQLQKYIFKNLRILKNPFPIPVGYQRNINIMFSLATTDIVSYIQSDMVICKNYDLEILKNLTPDTIISSTRIEPPLHPDSPEKITKNLGITPSDFKFDEFQLFVETVKSDKITNFWFAPFTMYKKHWNDIGGHDTLFRRSREDSDILYRFCIKGLKIKQSWSALVYHFTCTSSRGIEWWNSSDRTIQQSADNIELMKFLRKWGKFRHSTDSITNEDYKYNISINFKHCYGHENFIYDIFYMYNNISIDSDISMSIIRKKFELIDTVANIASGISEHDWKTYKNYYRTLDFDAIFNTNQVYDDIVVECELDVISDLDKYYLVNLPEIIHSSNTEPGIFELGTLKISINNIKNSIENNLIVTNPTFPDFNIFE